MNGCLCRAGNSFNGAELFRVRKLSSGWRADAGSGASMEPNFLEFGNRQRRLGLGRRRIRFNGAELFRVRKRYP